MHENNFEKQVREKMDQLGFDPADSIWERVDKEINKEKKHRRPLFWLFFFSGLALAGGAWYFSVYKNATPDKINYHQTGGEKKQEGEPGNKSGIKEPVNGEGVANEKLSKSNDLATNENKKPDEILSKNHTPHRGKQNAIKSARLQKDILIQKSVNSSDQTIAASGGKRAAESAAVVAGAEELSARDGKDSHQSNDSAAAKKSDPITENKSPVKDSVSNQAATAKKTEKKKSGGWKIGYTGSVGFSNVNQDLFKSISSSNTVSYAVAAPGTPSGQPLSNNNYSSSEVSTGFSFGAGVFVNRDLSKRFSVSGGLGYHYYSTKIQTGTYVSNTNLLSLSNASVNSFYTNGNTNAYTNQYHFIELPVTLNFQLNKSKKRPVIWEAGLSLSWLFSTNALYYDPSHNVYFENDDLMNRTQLNGITAIMVGFPLGKSALQLGPQLQYGFTGLLKNSSGNPGHLIYYGLKISFIPGKK